MNDFCYRTFGRKIEYIQSVVPAINWHLSKITKYMFDINDSCIKKVVLGFGKGTAGLEIIREIK
jgi:hypothetical protein